MRLGLLVYGTPTGLGYQTHSYYSYLKPSKVMLADISKLNKMPVYEDWYNFDIRTDGIPTNYEIDSFLDDLDVVLLAETPLNYYLFEEANRRGVKTILHVNPEFCDYFANPFLAKPTIFALPSMWLVDKFDPKVFPNVIHLPLPVDTRELPKRDVFADSWFFHIGGRPAIHDRNGTLDYIEASKLVYQVNKQAKFFLYLQDITPEIANASVGSPVEILEAKEPKDLYSKGSCLVMPRRYGGLCMPVQEAIACNIPVIMPDIDPNNRWLPDNWLVKARKDKSFFARLQIDVYQTDINDLADKMLSLNNSGQFIRMHMQAKEMGELLGWDKQLVRYKTVLEDICQ